MKNHCKLDLTMCMGLVVLMAAPAFSESSGSRIPFGGYSKDNKCGCYGAKATIKTAEEARKVIEGFLVGQGLRIGTMVEHPRFFRAELIDSKGSVRDVVIFSKDNGRVRSIN